MTSSTGANLPDDFSTMQPSMALNYAISNVGLYPSRKGTGTGSGGSFGERLIAEVSIFAGAQEPSSGWFFTDGQLLPIADNEVLFSLVGTIYGGVVLRHGEHVIAAENDAKRFRVDVHFGQASLASDACVPRP